MGFIFLAVIIFLVFVGIYYIWRIVEYNIFFKNLNVGKNIKCYISIDNSEDNLEMFLKKFLYMYLDNDIFENITIVTQNQNKDTYYMLKNLEKENGFIKVLDNYEIDLKENKADL